MYHTNQETGGAIEGIYGSGNERKLPGKWFERVEGEGEAFCKLLGAVNGRGIGLAGAQHQVKDNLVKGRGLRVCSILREGVHGGGRRSGISR